MGFGYFHARWVDCVDDAFAWLCAVMSLGASLYLQVSGAHSRGSHRRLPVSLPWLSASPLSGVEVPVLLGGCFCCDSMPPENVMMYRHGERVGRIPLARCGLHLLPHGCHQAALIVIASEVKLS